MENNKSVRIVVPEETTNVTSHSTESEAYAAQQYLAPSFVFLTTTAIKAPFKNYIYHLLLFLNSKRKGSREKVVDSIMSNIISHHD